jgi:ribosomal protein L34
MHTRIRQTRSKLKRIGFRARMKTKNGRKIVNKRRQRHGTFP